MGMLGSVGDSLGNYMSGATPQIMTYLGYILLAMVIGVVFVLVFILTQYKYKVKIFERRGNGTEGDFSIGKVKSDMARVRKNKEGQYIWQLLFARKKIPVIEDKYIYGKNLVFLFKSTPDTFIPVQFSSGNPHADFIPISANTSMWCMNEIKQAAMDYQVKSKLDQVMPYMITIGTVLCCCVLVAVVFYFQYKYAGGGTEAMHGLTQAITGWTDKLGVGVANAPPG